MSGEENIHQYNLVKILLVWVFQFFLFYPENGVISGLCLAMSFISEGLFCLWLWIKGVDIKQWEKRAFESA